MGGGILFIGSSSFTMWRNVNEDFPSYQITNRGFGGSTLLDQIRYIKDVVYPHSPRQIIIYCGENDLASSDSVDGKMVFERFETLFGMIREKFPKVNIVYVSMKPSPSRQLLLPEMRIGNDLIKKFLAKKKNAGYVDAYNAMIDDEGKPIADLFLQDNLHMNQKGYAIWQKLIQPHLLK
jgi:lysophospholipase L1-like esterase